MVVFTCNNCGDSLNKPSVEKHYQTICRRNKDLTCVDCLKDFRGDEYVSHTKCLTEDQRYAARGTMITDIKKGEVKQETWTEMIRSIMDKETNLDAPLRNMLSILSGYTNIPRKKQKFINFVGNSFARSYNNPSQIEYIWNLIEKYKAECAKKVEKPQSNGNANTAAKRKVVEEITEEPSKKKKKKVKENIPSESNGKHASEDSATDLNGNEDKFSFENKILDILNTKKQLSCKKLEKKVLKAYIKSKGVEKYTDKHVKKFNKHLKKMSQVEIQDDVVVLL